VCSICASCCILNELHFSKNPLILNFMVTELFQADVGTDMTKLIIILRNFSKASNYQKRNSGSRSNASDLKSGDAALQTPTGCRAEYCTHESTTSTSLHKDEFNPHFHILLEFHSIIFLQIMARYSKPFLTATFRLQI
jgi:hypothetical protein